MPTLRAPAAVALCLVVSSGEASLPHPSTLQGGSSAGGALVWHVDCDSGSDSASGLSRDTALATLARAQLLTRAHLQSAAFLASPTPTTIFFSGRCKRPLPFDARDGGTSEASRVTWRGYPGEAPPVISGGMPLLQSMLKPVTNADALAQLQPDVVPHVVQVDLAALGVDAGAVACHPYMGGEASILPGNLVSSGLEVFLYGDPTIGGDLSPLTLARWPNRDHVPQAWASGPVRGYTIFPDAATVQRLPMWAKQLADDPHSAFVHYLGGYEWNDHHSEYCNRVARGSAAASSSGTALRHSHVDAHTHILCRLAHVVLRWRLHIFLLDHPSGSPVCVTVPLPAAAVCTSPPPDPYPPILPPQI
jgi:hypothetical protein